jgi:hypothetical protein
MRRIKEFGPNLDGEVQIRRMTVSACPSATGLLLVHHFLSCFFSFFLGSMSDYLEEGGVEDAGEKGEPLGISTESLGMITSSSAIGVADSGKYSEA